MKPEVRIAVIIPAGPRDDVLDTLASVIHYTDRSRIILVIDDTADQGGTAGRVRGLYPEVVVIPAPPGHGTDGGLWVKLSAGYRWVLARYEPRLVMRLDADALLIGHGLEAAAEEAFAGSCEAGLLGSYRIGPDGGARDFSWSARSLRAQTGLRGCAHPGCRSSMRDHLSRARTYGYADGESVLGGAFIHSYCAVSRMNESGLFTQPWLAASKLPEDLIMSLLTVSAGYRMKDFGGPEDPMALRWRGLPAHPRDLLAAGKLVTHSVRSWGSLGEAEIRAIFAQARSGVSRAPDAALGSRE